MERVLRRAIRLDDDGTGFPTADRRETDSKHLVRLQSRASDKQSQDSWLLGSVFSHSLKSNRKQKAGTPPNKLGDTVLHAAAWKGYSDIVEMLLNKNARTDIRNNESKLAFEMATNAQCASLLKRKQGNTVTRTHSNAEEYLDDEDSD
ncbi:hypothetical protein CRENBAI_020176 [Crenichthys baileyi]|uniref:Osteoclast-stimulating factor 1 n=1 Tax=Crenichthys baileyi TaxID=28760 RepID=A0AAV9QZ78_9TELE